MELDGDIYIIQECENPEYSTDKEYIKFAQNYLWVGENKNKGLGIFARTSINITEIQFNNENIKYFLLCNVNGKFNLLGTWCQRGDSNKFRYIGQLWKYIQMNKMILTETLIAGDFNSNAIWDTNWKECNHSEVVRELSDIGIISYYHYLMNEKHGEETKITFYLQRKNDKFYHIDYFFGKSEWVHSLMIGSFDDWIKFSDHMPVITEINL